MTARTLSMRATLLAAASELLTKGGPDFVTLRAVGAAAGVSRTAPYRHFHDKDDLLSAVAAENLIFLADAMRRDAAGEAAAGTPLYRACLGYVRAAMQRPAHYRLVFGDFQIHNPSQALQDAADDCTQSPRIFRPSDVAALIVSGFLVGTPPGRLSEPPGRSGIVAFTDHGPHTALLRSRPHTARQPANRLPLCRLYATTRG